MAYLLGANVFIQGRKLHYGFDICPGFWEWIEMQSARGLVRRVEEVGASWRRAPMNWRHGRQHMATPFSCHPIRPCWRRFRP